VRLLLVHRVARLPQSSSPGCAGVSPAFFLLPPGRGCPHPHSFFFPRGAGALTRILSGSLAVIPNPSTTLRACPELAEGTGFVRNPRGVLATLKMTIRCSCFDTPFGLLSTNGEYYPLIPTFSLQGRRGGKEKRMRVRAPADPGEEDPSPALRAASPLKERGKGRGGPKPTGLGMTAGSHHNHHSRTALNKLKAATQKGNVPAEMSHLGYNRVNQSSRRDRRFRMKVSTVQGRCATFLSL